MSRGYTLRVIIEWIYCTVTFFAHCSIKLRGFFFASNKFSMKINVAQILPPSLRSIYFLAPSSSTLTLASIPVVLSLSCFFVNVCIVFNVLSGPVLLLRPTWYIIIVCCMYDGSRTYKPVHQVFCQGSKPTTILFYICDPIIQQKVHLVYFWEHWDFCIF